MSALMDQTRTRFNRNEGFKKPLRVAFVIDELATAGTETQLLALLKNLDRTIVSPLLVLLRGNNPRSRQLEPADCPVLRLEVQSLHKLSTLMLAWRFQRWLRDQQIDVVQAYFPDSSYFALPIAWLAGVPERIRVRNNLGHWLTPFHRGMCQILRWFTTASITNSQRGRDQLLAEGYLPRQVSVLANGVDLDRFLQLDPISLENPKICTIGVVANLRHVKGIDLLIQAARHILDSNPDLHFEIAGEGEMRDSLENQIAAAGIAHRFHLVGLVQDIPQFLSKLEVAVLCSRSEGMSNALLEYMAAARPVVATRVGAADEMLVDGSEGILVAPDDWLALKDGILAILQNRVKARNMGLLARQKAATLFRREAMVARFQQFYRQLQEKI